MNKPLSRRRKQADPPTTVSQFNNSTLPTQSLSEKSGHSSGSGGAVRWSWYIFIFLLCVYAGSRYTNGDSETSPQVKQDISASSSNVVGSVDKAEAPKSVSKPQEVNDAAKGETSNSEENNEIKQSVVEIKSTSQKQSTVCLRYIPFDLFDTSTWPTPYTPSYFDKEPLKSKQVVLIKNDPPPKYDHEDEKYGSIGKLFGALDLAYDKKCQVYITKDADWLWDALLPLFFLSDIEKNKDFWKKIQDILGVIIVNDEADAKVSGKELILVTPDQEIATSTLTPIQMRNRRDTVFRKLFQQTPPRGSSFYCYAIHLYGLEHDTLFPGSAEYTVISPGISEKSKLKFKDYKGGDKAEINAKFVKSILTQLGMHTESNFIFFKGDMTGRDHDELKALLSDTELETFGVEEETHDYKEIAMLHLSVLADVFIADPTQWSLMVARMRYALGMRNTFVLTEKKAGESDGEETLVSVIDHDEYLELYDRELGPWMG